MKCFLIKHFFINILSFINFLIQLIFSFDLEINDVILISKSILSFLKTRFIYFFLFFNVTTFFVGCAKIFNYSDITSLIEIETIFKSYFFKVFSSVKHFCSRIFIFISFSFNSFKYSFHYQAFAL